MTEPPARRVVVVVFDGVQLLDAAGPIEVFTGANRASRRANYQVEIAATGTTVTTSSGVVMQTRPMRTLRGGSDTVIVAGGDCLLDEHHDDDLLAQIGRLARSTRRVCSVCSGAMLLGAAGLLDGRTATTHWAAAERLASRYPAVRVDADPIYIEDDGVWTSAGVSAAIDLSLALVAVDVGSEVANRIAQWLVLPTRRTGLQSQFAPRSRIDQVDDPLIAELLRTLDAEPYPALTNEQMAALVHLSPRQFSRRFTAATGVQPARFALRLRLDRARALLESTDMKIATVANQCGFSHTESFNRAFLREYGTSPSRHRSEFGLSPTATGSARH